MKTHMIANLIYAMGILCLAYFILIAVMTRMNSFFHVIWLVFAMFFFMLGKTFVLARTGIIVIPKPLIIGAGVIAGALLVLLVFVEGIIIKYASSDPDPGAKYVIILGAQVKGKVPSLALLSRLEAAKEYLDENPDTKVIVSGARGYGEDITEAQCMFNWLTSHGIEEGRIILEQQSVNTDENIRFSRSFIEDASDYVVLVTNSFHTFRGEAIAKKQGLLNVQGKGSPSTFYMIPTYYLREAMAVVKYKLTGQI